MGYAKVSIVRIMRLFIYLKCMTKWKKIGEMSFSGEMSCAGIVPNFESNEFRIPDVCIVLSVVKLIAS